MYFQVKFRSDVVNDLDFQSSRTSRRSLSYERAGLRVEVLSSLLPDALRFNPTVADGELTSPKRKQSGCGCPWKRM
jgi:hypothetical protein